MSSKDDTANVKTAADTKKKKNKRKRLLLIEAQRRRHPSRECQNADDPTEMVWKQELLQNPNKQS